MNIQEGDRFINTKTGTIIWVEEIRKVAQTYFVDHQNPDGYPHYTTYVYVRNLQDGNKTKTLEIEWFKTILEMGKNYIIPYKGEPIKPIKFLKEYKYVSND